ncbi:MAG TPA: substrate-binding domain-containing protein [Fimbriimonadaceae bacterium]|nr:substrate-binding domain-containing protein [Fimbriimonadaceae bacterium]
MRATKYLVIAAAIGFTIAGCGSGDKSDTGTTTGTTSTSGTTAATTSTGGGGTSASDITIAVIPKGSTHDYWKHVKMGADQAASELGVKVDFEGPEKEDDKQSQINMVENMISKKVKGIVLAPLDNKALVKPIEEAAAANIPVVIIDSGVDTKKILAMVSTDNYKGGQVDADELIRLLNGKGNIAVLRYEKGSASTDAREKGFEDEIKAKAPNIKIVSDTTEAGATRDSAQRAAENMLAAFRKPDGSLGLDGIFCPNESSTFGMMKVLEENKWAGKVKFVGFDAAPELVDGLNKGEIDALVVQNPVKMGHDGVKVLVDYIKNGTKPQDEDTGATLVTKAKLSDPEIAKLVAPAQ